MEFLRGEKEVEAAQWMNAASMTARHALCQRAKCGAVIVNNSEIIGKGYNAPPLDNIKCCMCSEQLRPNKQKYDATCCIHAEWRAIIDALKNTAEKIKGSRLYFISIDDNGMIKKSEKPYCTVCSRLALDTGIAEFLLWHRDGICAYPTDEYNNLSYQFTG